MGNIIRFTCFKCGCHQLMLSESAMHRYEVQVMELDGQGYLSVVSKKRVDDLCGDTLGYCCLNCRYPDCHHGAVSDGVLWGTLSEVQSAGAISWTGRVRVEHKCMICLSDGNMTPLIVEVAHPGLLSVDERRLVLQQEQIENGLIISQLDPGIKSLECPNWKHVKHHSVQVNTNLPQ
ncbi:MAG: hypothetical protein RR719_09680 [Akkermansia sp.]